MNARINLNSNSFDFFIFTRFGIDVEDLEWFENRFRIFEAITLSSMKNQTDTNFTWIIFIGEKFIDSINARLTDLLAGSQFKYEIVKDRQCNETIKNAIAKHATNDYIISGRIDDDDAWSINHINEIKQTCLSLIKKGKENFGFSYEDGVEWLYTDLIDITKLHNDGQRIVRKEGCYPYNCPFHSMSSFVLVKKGTEFPFFNRIHGTRGDILLEYNFGKYTFKTEKPSWLYFRHQQTNSSTHKAHKMPKLDISLQSLCSTFGLNLEKVEDLISDASNIKYPMKKRRHGDENKGNILLDISMGQNSGSDAMPIITYTTAGSVMSFKIENIKFSGESRACIYDRENKVYVHFTPFTGDTITSSFILEGKPSRYMLKIQVKEDRKWKDKLFSGKKFIEI
ncbi:glycosyltransferase [Zobellella iuensis]|uniref:Rhamnosyl transferase n=1 Tax=Zobellella iuensis TaxID=2803811 RepID=A0ABS1QSD8_9GAMM|nr:glycosyltransferase [Zobellella iuensis]MBL1377760.1 hypothetical protein [Zobellella iuensis]